MPRLPLFFAILLGFNAASAQAQPSEAPKWDLSATAALFNASPAENDNAYRDDWYFDGRYAVTAGHYWTQHLKTEVEYAVSGEGSIYNQVYVTPPGGLYGYPLSSESFYRLEQGAIRMVWQFGDNAWVHPYLSGGLVVDRERRRTFVPEQYQYPAGRTNPLLITPQVNPAPSYEHRLGYSIGAGVKLYLAPKAFFTTGANVTHSKPARTVSLLAGFGFDF